MMKKKIILSSLVLLFITALVGCSNTKQANISNDWGTIEKQAKKEGKLASVGMPDTWANWIGTWKDLKSKYGIKQSDTDMNSAEEIQKFKTEGTKGTADIGDVGMNVAPTAKAKGVLAKYKGQYWKDIPNWAKDKEGYWSTGYTGTIVFITDKKNVEASDAPKSWADLKNGNYKVSIGDPTGGAQSQYAILAAATTMGGDESNIKPALKYFADLNKNHRLSTVEANVQNLKKGEVDVAVMWDFNALNYRHLIDEGRYEVTVPSEGSVMSGYSQIINKNAPHPYSARLARDYILSDEGQVNLAKGYARPIRENVKLPDDVKAKLLPDSAYKNIYHVKDNEVWNKTTLKIGQLWQSEVQSKG